MTGREDLDRVRGLTEDARAATSRVLVEVSREDDPDVALAATVLEALVALEAASAKLEAAVDRLRADVRLRAV